MHIELLVLDKHLSVNSNVIGASYWNNSVGDSNRN